MTWPYRTTLAAAIVGDALHAAEVREGPAGVRVVPREVIEAFLRTPSEESRRLLGEVAGGTRVVLVLPSSWCALKAMGLSWSQWNGAREELAANISGFFPFPAGQALAGYVARVGPEGESAGGYIVAADRARVQPWLDALRSALGREVDEVLTPHMALAGLGLQRESSAVVLDPDAGGAGVCHRLRLGEVVELCARSSGASSDGEASRVLPEAGGASAGSVSGSELAWSAVLAGRVGPESYAPVLGRRARPPRRWLAPAACALAAAGLLPASGALMESRYREAISTRLAQSEAERASIDEARRALADLERYAALAREASGKTFAAGPSLLVDLAEVFGVVREAGAGAFVYRVELDGSSLSLQGEAPRAGDVLRAVEKLESYQSARQASDPSPLEERAGEVFHVRADRVAPSGTGGGR